MVSVRVGYGGAADKRVVATTRTKPHGGISPALGGHGGHPDKIPTKTSNASALFTCTHLSSRRQRTAAPSCFPICGRPGLLPIFLSLAGGFYPFLSFGAHCTPNFLILGPGALPIDLVYFQGYYLPARLLT